MDFLREKLTVTAAAPGLSETFFADLLQPRPDFDTLVAFAGWSATVQQEMIATKARKNCPVAWVGLFVDQVGVSIILHFAHPLQLCSAKMAARTLTHFLVKDMQQALWSSLRPLDELDRMRIDGWRTPMSVRPPGLGKKRAREEEEGGCQTLAKRPKTMAQFLAEEDDRDGCDEVDCPPALTLPRLQATRRPADELDLLRDLPGVWEYRMKTEGTVVVAEVGDRPALTFVRCHHEARRIEMMLQLVRAEYRRFSMVVVVRVAAAMAKAGSIPDHVGPRGRKSDFIKRCATALGILDSNAEPDITKLPREDQNIICSILGGEGEPYDGCMMSGCLDKRTTWITRKVCVRCSRCDVPKSFGRLWRTSREMMQPELIRLAERIQRSEARTRRDSESSVKRSSVSAQDRWISDDEGD